MLVLLYAKMLKETEETIGFVVIIFIIGGISIRGARLPPHPEVLLRMAELGAECVVSPCMCDALFMMSPFMMWLTF